MARKKKKLKLGRQQWLLVALGVVIVVGIGYVLYQQQGIGSYLKGAVGGQCNPSQVTGDIQTNLVNASVKAGDLVQVTPQGKKVLVKNTKEDVEDKAKKKATLLLECPALADANIYFQQPANRCGTGCRNSGSPQLTPIGLAAKSDPSDKPKCDPESKRSPNGQWSATAQCYGYCRAVDSCIVDEKVPPPSYGLTCSRNKETMGMDEPVIATAAMTGGLFNVTWSSSPGAVGGGATYGPNNRYFQAKYNAPGDKIITATVKFPDRQRSVSCKKVVVVAPPAAKPQCDDGNDNDGDTKIDLADPGCKNNKLGTDEKDSVVVAPPKTHCADGIDNDGDGFTDYLKDYGCANAQGTTEVTQCQDGKDNDFDIAKDLADFGCQNSVQTLKENILSAECQDTIDNDGDGNIDWNKDKGCTSYQDNDELPKDPTPTPTPDHVET